MIKIDQNNLWEKDYLWVIYGDLCSNRQTLREVPANPKRGASKGDD